MGSRPNLVKRDLSYYLGMALVVVIVLSVAAVCSAGAVAIVRALLK